MIWCCFSFVFLPLSSCFCLCAVLDFYLSDYKRGILQFGPIIIWIWLKIRVRMAEYMLNFRFPFLPANVSSFSSIETRFTCPLVQVVFIAQDLHLWSMFDDSGPSWSSGVAEWWNVYFSEDGRKWMIEGRVVEELWESGRIMGKWKNLDGLYD